jgi:hypothetical protein
MVLTTAWTRSVTHFLPALTPTDIHWVCCTVAKTHL